MFDIGFFELMLIAGLGLIILGPERLPKAARTIGLYIGRIRRQMSSIQQDIERQIREEDLRDKLKDPFTRFDEEGESIHPPAEQQSEQGTEQQSEQQTEQSAEEQQVPGSEHFIKPTADGKKSS